MTEALEFLRAHPWSGTMAAALFAVVAAMLVHRLARVVLSRLSRHSPVVQTTLQAIDKPAAAALPIAALLFVLELAPDGTPYLARAQHLSVLLFVLALTWLAVGAISGFAQAMIDSNPATMEDNLHARRVQTQTRVLARSAMVVVVIAGVAIALMTFPGARQVGASLLASAGVLGIVGGIAARPVFSNLIAGLQIALAQPIRIDDVLIVQDQFGRVEEITGTYVVLKLWDEKRLIVPLQWFIENPFQNWTRRNADVHQSVFLRVHFTMPMQPLRDEMDRIVRTAPEWDGRTAKLMVTDADSATLQVRVLVSAHSSGKAFDLGCKLREGLYAFMARDYPDHLPQTTVTHLGGSAPGQNPLSRMTTEMA